MAFAKDFRELIIWQRSHDLALMVYRVTDTFPNSEQFGLTNQLRRAAVSVGSNIAEGFERNSAKDFAHFLVISRGSLAEIASQIMLARDLRYVTPEDCEKILEEIKDIHKMLNAFKKTLNEKGPVRTR
jgi:four helix bundle protein